MNEALYRQLINLAVIGCGAITEINHIRALRKVPFLRIASLCDVDIKRAEYIKRRHGLYSAETVTDYREILRNRNINAVLIATPPPLHSKMVIESARANKHVFCEKPLAMTSEEAYDVAANIHKGIKFMIGFNRRFVPVYAKVKEMISEGLIGSILCVKILDQGNIRSWPSVSKFHYSSEEGGGVLFEIGCHFIDLARWLVGEVAAVSAKIFSKKFRNVDDTAKVDLTFKSGCKAEIFVSFSASSLRSEMNVRGQKGEIGVRSGDLFLSIKDKCIFKRGPLVLGLNRSSEDSYQREFLHFGRSILEGLEPSPNIVDAIENMKIISAANESSRLGKEIYL